MNALSLKLIPAEHAARQRAELIASNAADLSVAALKRYMAAVASTNPEAYRLLGSPAPALHFVGFKDDRYHAAVRVFGPPDFVHRVWDTRAAQEIAPFDRVVFAQYADQPPSPYSWDDSNQLEDPAAAERRDR